MANKIVSAMVAGGKANAGPPLGPALGPLGVNIGDVVAEINHKTSAFAGINVPVEVSVDAKAKTFEVTVGTPPTAALIKKELKLEKGAKGEKDKKGKEIVGNLPMEKVIAIAHSKEDALTGTTTKEKVLEVLGACFSMGVTVNGQSAREVQAQVKAGKISVS